MKGTIIIFFMILFYSKQKQKIKLIKNSKNPGIILWKLFANGFIKLFSCNQKFLEFFKK